METLKEDKNGYVSEAQREVLVQLVTHPVIEGSFFLTGGTALSVFYLNHRLSDDLDFFTLRPLDLGEIDFWIRTQWPKAAVKIKEGPQFLSLLIREVRVDFIKMCQNTPQLCWGDEWPTLSPGGRGLG